MVLYAHTAVCTCFAFVIDCSSLYSVRPKACCACCRDSTRPFISKEELMSYVFSKQLPGRRWTASYCHSNQRPFQISPDWLRRSGEYHATYPHLPPSAVLDLLQRKTWVVSRNHDFLSPAHLVLIIARCTYSSRSGYAALVLRSGLLSYCPATVC